MRILIITLATIFAFSLNTSAQKSTNSKDKKNTLKYGYGSTFHSNEMVGTFQYGEYTRFFGKWVGLGLAGGYINADLKNETGNGVLLAFNSWKGDANLYLLPINNTKNSLKFGGGGSYWSGEFKSRDSIEMDFIVEKAENYGWNLVAEYEVYVMNTLILSSRAAYTKAENGESYFFFGLSGGLKF